MNSWTKKRKKEVTNLYIYNEIIIFLSITLKTTERINMGLGPYGAKSSVDGHRLLHFWIPHTVPDFILD